MCGIVAFKGETYNASDILFKGMHLLEYRGYDSSGIALIDDGNIKTFKKKGRVKKAEKLFNKNKIKSKIGIGHTRWATHGEPNDVNSHPIESFHKEFAIVHNGIIENYMELKTILLKNGYKFYTETDTEVLVNFIEFCIRDLDDLNRGLTFALSKVKGAFALVLICKSNPELMYGSRKGSPLAFGRKKNNFFIASDATPIINFTDQIIYLENDQIIKIENNEFEILNYNLKRIEKKFEKVNIELQKLEIGDFDSFMLKEIMEQPNSLNQSMLGRIQITKNNIVLGGISQYTNKLIKCKRILIIGCGTSWHAGLVAEYFFEKHLNVPVEVEYASEFRYRDPIIYRDDIVFVISQSGETADTLEATKIAKDKGATVIGIVNAVGSSIARETHEGCYLHAGPEIGVASTKAFTSQLLVLFMIGLKAGHIKGNISEKKFHELIAEIHNLPKKVEIVFKDLKKIESIAYKIYEKNHCMFMGRGNNFPVALEGALKLKEISYIHAEGYPAAELKHGPIALIDKNMPAIVICTKSREYEKMISNIQEIKSRKAITIGIIDEKNIEVRNILDHHIVVPTTKADFSPLINIIPLQLLAYFTAKLRGCDVDKPRNLAKSVTVE
jgi:glucosamine--fructose-6-phosphate aminotransferase (isomerizing)